MKTGNLWGAFALTALVASGQPPVTFEAASIRRNLSGEQNTRIDISGNRLTVTNASLKTLIRNGWELQSFQFTGGPPWLDTEMYDISATTGTHEKIDAEQLKPLLRSLLAERFGLRFHRETKEGLIYALVVSKEGPKLREGAASEQPGINTRKAPGDARMQGTREPISILAFNLANQLGRFVVDKTSLPGAYDWVLEWDPDPNAESTRPSLFTAVQQQLGLKLESQKGPMELFVIDHAERASQN